MRIFVLIVAALAVMAPSAQETTVIRAGLVIDRNTTLRPGASAGPAHSRAEKESLVAVIDRWDVHESIVDEAPIAGGRHRLRVEYFEHVGWAERRVEILKPVGANSVLQVRDTPGRA
jgi:hypothetical protein